MRSLGPNLPFYPMKTIRILNNVLRCRATSILVILVLIFSPLRMHAQGAVTKVYAPTISSATTSTTYSGTGATGNSAIMPKIVNQMLGTKFKVIGGYSEGAGQTLALERGEVDGICGLSYSTLKASRPDWFRDHKLNIILQIGLEKLRDLPDVPNAIDLVSDPDSKRVLELILIRQEMGRPFAAPQGIPEDRKNALRQAFDDTMKDPEFLEAAKRSALDIDPVSGVRAQEIMERLYQTPRAIIDRIEALRGPQ